MTTVESSGATRIASAQTPRMDSLIVDGEAGSLVLVASWIAAAMEIAHTLDGWREASRVGASPDEESMPILEPSIGMRVARVMSGS
jgi:hypothetical protein